MESLINTEFTIDRIDTILNDSVRDFKSLCLGRSRSRIDDTYNGRISMQNKIKEDQNFIENIHPIHWSLHNVLEWLVKEELNFGEIIRSFGLNNIVGETLL